MSYAALKNKLLSTNQGKVEAFKMNLSFALGDALKEKAFPVEVFSDWHLARILELDSSQLDSLLTGDLDLTLSQVAYILDILGKKLTIGIEE